MIRQARLNLSRLIEAIENDESLTDDETAFRDGMRIVAKTIMAHYRKYGAKVEIEGSMFKDRQAPKSQVGIPAKRQKISGFFSVVVPVPETQWQGVIGSRGQVPEDWERHSEFSFDVTGSKGKDQEQMWVRVECLIQGYSARQQWMGQDVLMQKSYPLTADGAIPQLEIDIKTIEAKARPFLTGKADMDVVRDFRIRTRAEWEKIRRGDYDRR